MMEEKYREWIDTLSSGGNYISRIKTLEKDYGDIDILYDNDKCLNLLFLLTYTKEDQYEKKEPRHILLKKSESVKDKYKYYYEGSADYKNRVNEYIKFRESLQGEEPLSIIIASKKIDEPTKDKAIVLLKKTNENTNNIYPETADTNNCIEGAKTTVEINKYERDTVARQKCIAHHGCYCHVCDLNFEKMYGEIGKGFIHVHHLTPLHEINEEHNVDPVNDLIPVCPNCHAMLHRKVDGAYLSTDKLKEIIK